MDFKVEEEPSVEVHRHLMDRHARYDELPVCPEKPDRIELLLYIIQVHINRILFPVLKQQVNNSIVDIDCHHLVC